MKLVLLALAILGYCFNINSGCCCKKKNNNNGNGGGGSGNLGSRRSTPAGGGGKPTPAETNKFDAEINVGPDSITIKPVGNSEIKLSDKVDLNGNKLVNNSFCTFTTVYKFNYSKLIKNANVTVDNKIKEKPYLIAMLSLKGDESSKYIVIVSKEDGDMKSLFQGLNLTGVSLLSSIGITGMKNMFRGCKDLTVCNINIDTSNVKNMSLMFYECSSLTTLSDISKWNTKNVTDMSCMFWKCSSLLSLPDISKWDASKVTDISYMFNGCRSLSSLPDISKWNTSNVTDISWMFYGCESLETLPDITKWDISKVTSRNSMFGGCTALKNIPDKFKS